MAVPLGSVMTAGGGGGAGTAACWPDPGDDGAPEAGLAGCMEAGSPDGAAAGCDVVGDELAWFAGGAVLDLHPAKSAIASVADAQRAKVGRTFMMQTPFS
jgi:hypothetical protein